MQLLAVTLLLGCMASARLLHFPKSNAVMNSPKLVKLSCRTMLAKKDDIINAGENAPVLLYNGDSRGDLDALRSKKRW